MIILKCDEIDLKEITMDEFEDNNIIEIFLNDTLIGDIEAYPCSDCFGLVLISIDEEYRGKGYGTEAMKILIEVCSKLGVDYIHGDSPNKRKAFYKRLGAKYECRDEDDETYFNDRFYIDLN